MSFLNLNDFHRMELLPPAPGRSPRIAPPGALPGRENLAESIIDVRQEFHRTPILEKLDGLPQDIEELLAGSSAEERDAWVAAWVRAASRVCRITFGDVVATGFLIGPDLVLTNYHNVEILKGDRALARFVRLTFDYHEDSPEIPQPGVSYSLADDWLIDWSPPSLADAQPDPKTSQATSRELDYAIVRLNGAPAADIVGGRERGVIELPSEPYPFGQSEPLVIVQHTVEEPLRMTLDAYGILGVNECATRVTYRTNTRDGASGSPCFNRHWRLVALHHGGSPGGRQPYNEGVPIHTIRKHLGPAALVALGIAKIHNPGGAPIFAPPP